MSAHKTIKKLTEKAKNEKALLFSKRPIMELQINRAIRKEAEPIFKSNANIAGINSNF